MTRRAVASIAAGTAGVAIVSVWLLAEVPFFRVRQVELVGVRYLAPAEVIAGAGVQLDQNLFDRLGRLEESLRALPGVADARATRRLPGTLRFEVTERVPVALVPGPDGLVALDRDAQPLPFDPAQTEMDLPVVPRADSVLTAVLATVIATDPELFARVETVERLTAGVAMTLADGRLILNVAPTLQEVRNLGAVWRHVVRDNQSFEELDGRFTGMVIRRGTAG